MRRSFRAELLKLLTTRALYGVLAGEVAVVVLTAASTVASAKADTLTGALHDQVFFLLVAINVGLFSLIIGMRTVTDEYRHETIVHAFLADPKRRKTLVAKAVASAIAAVALSAVALAAMSLVAVPLASAKGGSFTVAGSDVSAAGGFLLANGLWAIVGVGVASLVRHQVAAIVGGVVWIYVVENLGAGFLGDAGAYLPGQAAYALAQAQANSTAVEPTAAAAVMTSYAVVLFLLALFVTRRRDVG